MLKDKISKKQHLMKKKLKLTNQTHNAGYAYHRIR